MIRTHTHAQRGRAPAGPGELVRPSGETHTQQGQSANTQRGGETPRGGPSSPKHAPRARPHGASEGTRGCQGARPHGGRGHVCLLARRSHHRPGPAGHSTGGLSSRAAPGAGGSQRGPPHLPQEGLGKFLPCQHLPGLFPTYTHTARGSCTRVPTLCPGTGPIPPATTPHVPPALLPARGGGRGSALLPISSKQNHLS